MQLEIVAVQPPLTRIITSIIAYSGYNAPSRYEILLPDGVAQLVIPLDETTRGYVDAAGSHELKGGWFTGVHTSPICYLGEQNAATFCIRFSATGFYRLCNTPLQLIQDQIIPADEILGARFAALRQRLLDGKTTKDRIAVLESFFAASLENTDSGPSISTYVLHELARGQRTIRQIVDRSGYSWKHMIELFKADVGLTPKQYQRLLRFNRVLYLLHERPRASSSFTTADDYFDQSHVIREFRSFSGLTPHAYQSTDHAYPHVVATEDAFRPT